MDAAERSSVKELCWAIVVSLGAAMADAPAWRGWPYIFATGLLLGGAWALMSRGGLLVQALGASAVLVAGHEFYDPHQLVLPFVGEFSVGIVALVVALRLTASPQRPGRYIIAVAAIGMGITALGGYYPSTVYALPALLIVGLLGASVDPRAAVAVAGVPMIVVMTRFDWMLRSWIDASTWPMTVAICLATLAVLNHLRGEGRRT